MSTTTWIAEDIAIGNKPRTDEDAAMSAPRRFYIGENKEAARNALLNALLRDLGYRHIRTDDEARAAYVTAIGEVTAGTDEVKPQSRTYRIREAEQHEIAWITRQVAAQQRDQS